MNRSAGILCPVFSIPANQGIGDLGQKTIRMIDIIADAGYTIWQILPLQMTGPTHSPYQTYSSFAGDPIYINLDRLCEMGLLTQSSIVNCNKFKDFVEYDKIREFKESYFQKAFKVFKKEFDSFKEDFEAFKRDAFWLEEWSAYSLFKSFYNGAPWFEWEDEYKNWPENRDIDLDDYKDEIFYIEFLQFVFYKQLDEIQMYAHARNLKIMGDMPFYVDLDSADVWCNQMRYQYFYMSGGGDAVASRNMYDQSEVTRSYMYPQMIDQNWKYNRETALPAFGDGSMELIPTVGPGWNKLIQDGRGAIGNSPIVKRDPATYRTICNVAKMNAGRNRLIFIDSYNKYNFDSFIEPTVEGYGNGYGKTYLQITREQFKKN